MLTNTGSESLPTQGHDLTPLLLNLSLDREPAPTKYAHELQSVSEPLEHQSCSFETRMPSNIAYPDVQRAVQCQIRPLQLLSPSELHEEYFSFVNKHSVLLSGQILKEFVTLAEGLSTPNWLEMFSSSVLESSVQDDADKQAWPKETARSWIAWVHELDNTLLKFRNEASFKQAWIESDIQQMKTSLSRTSLTGPRIRMALGKAIQQEREDAAAIARKSDQELGGLDFSMALDVEQELRSMVLDITQSMELERLEMEIELIEDYQQYAVVALILHDISHRRIALHDVLQRLTC